tara:strand:- start:190 stop:381 length:192 start_codon:yes stop_codon:yes gene_type:complete
VSSNVTFTLLFHDQKTDSTSISSKDGFQVTTHRYMLIDHYIKLKKQGQLKPFTLKSHEVNIEM